VSHSYSRYNIGGGFITRMKLVARYLLWKDGWLAGCLSVKCRYCVKMAYLIL